jgi:TPR repeat protein
LEVWENAARNDKHGDSCNALGDFWYEGVEGYAADHKQAIEWYTIGHQHDHVGARASLAYMLRRGEGIERSVSRAGNMIQQPISQLNSLINDELDGCGMMQRNYGVTVMIVVRLHCISSLI